ncbi:sensor histidine kinase [Devosia sediminis]|uniref:histidine kinase n=1 Tax=Devosia sediminis TaxID=2798801 RepID=A0A934J0R9_9HYPH|nr:sensor histidine kinase KdpD [Devosia sediminis]MBJ3786685.1 sensor histidine kinase KdpD [Devosia sediminis]
MEEIRRPDPDSLLAATQKAQRGRLKVFLGMAPGVGKTYEMLRQARRRKADGLDVVIGLVETHGRKETESLLRGMDVLPRQPIEHRGRTLLEFDLDAALARKPELLVVDEYAHSNAPGSRHPKRWQDVEELLDAGIDVWTTLNVQHLESLVDVVLRITGVRQRETVPDSALSRADDIEVIDITPDELRERMAAGKVYVPETARLAADNFFKPENLTALRELALRRAAQTVDDQLNAAMRVKGLEGPWAAGDRILVLVADDAMASALVRQGRRLSDTMKDAPWIVAHVARSRGEDEAATTSQLTDALKLAEQLGATTLVLNGSDLVAAVLRYAGQNNVTQIVIGKGRDSRLREMLGLSLASELLRAARGVAIHVVTEGGQSATPARRRPWLGGLRRGWQSHLVGLVYVGMATGIAYLLDLQFERADLGMIYLAAILAAAILHGLAPGLVAAVCAFLLYNLLFLSPRYSFAIGSPTDILTLLVFLAVALATGILAGRSRDRARDAQRRAADVASLLVATRAFSRAPTRADAARALAEQATATTGAKSMVLLPREGDLEPVAGAPELAQLGAGAMAAARWAWERGEPAGEGTGTLPQTSWTFRPLQGVRSRTGVLGVEHLSALPGSDQEKLVTALADGGGVAIERAELALQSVEAEALRRSDRFRTTLLNSVSHDLRTPLSTVLGASSTLIELGDRLAPEVKDDLVVSIREEAERLNHYIGNLLDMSRLEGGGVKLRLEPASVETILRTAASRLSRRLGEHSVAYDFPAALPDVVVDPGLLEQAVVNILENAIAYSPDNTEISIAAYEDRAKVVISIEDEGKGIPTAELERVFDKFRRLEEPTDRGKGVGLGLSITRGFIEAMGGTIVAASPIHGDKGTRMLIALNKSDADIWKPA